MAMFSLPLEYTAEAQQDILSAFRYYEQQQKGLGEQFLDALDSKLKDIASHPDFYSYLSVGKSKFRDVAVTRFPYLIVYEVTISAIIIYAVHFTQRKPRNY